MTVVYSVNYGHSTSSLAPSLFLAGPTPRSPEVESWRPCALKLLQKQGYEGLVFVPEPEAGPLAWNWPKQDQLNWERVHLNQARVILFWIPRSEDLPGLTTNLEFGMWLQKDPTKVVFGSPPSAWKMDALEYYATIYGVERHMSLEATVEAGLNRISHTSR